MLNSVHLVGVVRGVPPAPVFGSLAGGLGRLPLEIAQRGDFVVRTGVTVREIRRVGAP